MKRLQVLPHLLSPLLLLAAATQPAQAATEFGDMVPTEIVELFLGNPLTGGAALYSDIMDDFPPLTIPAGFTVLASADQGYSQRVVLRTTLDEESATSALGAMFAAAGYQQIERQGMLRPDAGFVTSDRPVTLPQQYCSDEHGMMLVSVESGANAQRQVDLTRSVPMAGQYMPSCAEIGGNANQALAARALGGGGMELAQYLPRLVLPATNGSRRPSPFMGGGGGGSGNDWETRSALVSEWSLEEVFTHFTSQIEEQGWTVDTTDSGSFMAAGAWTKTVEDDQELLGMLTIVAMADANYELRFRLVRKGSGAPGAGGGIFVGGVRAVPR
jgi:hypothetical protein